ncbi:hypothetical protein [Proteus myxofaciens]|uniref:Putative lipoprotein n=1 Tax=Proteus myxofaciens ATCC 19692 TaxID=1354337 RepID=A0A198FD54_9GAMM|nr:hypothetical protein [Proteus myxofaciens]OAT22823.1 putative lipoprotein [Proteus myxofaciens ATCC 19692]
MKSISIFILLLSFFSYPALAKYHEWDCWGWQKYTNKDYERKTNISYSTDICVRTDDKPLYVDVYLHKLSFSGNSNSMDFVIQVKVKNKRTNQSYYLDSTEKSNIVSEYFKRFEFPVALSGEYEITVNRINVIYRKSGKTTGYFNNIDARYGINKLKSEACCCSN